MTENPFVVRIIEDLKRERINKKEFLDVVHEKGNQYVELVQEGGAAFLRKFD